MRNDFKQFFQLMCPTLLDEEKLSLPYEKGETNDSDIYSFKNVEAPVADTDDKELIHPAQTDKPPIEGEPTIVARRNRRLRSKYRNWQAWDTKKKVWVNPNARYTRRRDADEEIKKMNPSD